MSGPQQTAPGVRLSKRVADLRACSRREAEQYIEGGWVRVDGQIVEEPQFRVQDHQRIEIDPDASLQDPTPVTLLWHKPAGRRHDIAPQAPLPVELDAAHQFAADSSGLRLLKRHRLKQAAFMPIEDGASGLVVFTQDWRVARKLSEDAGTMEQEFVLEVAGELPAETLQRLQRMQEAGGRPLPHFKVSLNSTGADTSRLRLAVKGSHPGLAAWLCERVGLQMRGLRRIRIARVALGQLPPGQWRFLLPHERF